MLRACSRLQHSRLRPPQPRFWFCGRRNVEGASVGFDAAASAILNPPQCRRWMGGGGRGPGGGGLRNIESAAVTAALSHASAYRISAYRAMPAPTAYRVEPCQRLPHGIPTSDANTATTTVDNHNHNHDNHVAAFSHAYRTASQHYE